MNDIANLPVSEAYLLPRYPIVPEPSAPVSYGLARAYGQAAATVLLALVLSVLFIFTIARLSGEPEVSRQHASMSAVIAPSEPVATPTPAVR